MFTPQSKCNFRKVIFPKKTLAHLQKYFYCKPLFYQNNETFWEKHETLAKNDTFHFIKHQ